MTYNILDLFGLSKFKGGNAPLAPLIKISLALGLQCVRDITRPPKYSYQSILSPDVFFLTVSSKSCFYTFGCIDWVRWRLARGEDGRGWSTTWAGLVYKKATGDPSFLEESECDSSPFDQQSILMKDHFTGTGKLFEMPIFIFTFLNNGYMYSFIKINYLFFVQHIRLNTIRDVLC